MKVIILSLLLVACVNADFLTVQEFQTCVAAFGHGTPSTAIAQSFISGASSCGGITTRGEALIAIAEMGWESAGFTARTEWACSNGQWQSTCNTYDNSCNTAQQFFGRGFIQTTGCPNYKSCMNYLNSKGYNVDFVSNPGLVAEDPYAMLCAFYYWESAVHPTCNNQMGSATRAINGALECTPNGDTSIAKKRWNNLKACLSALNTSPSCEGIKEDGCYTNLDPVVPCPNGQATTQAQQATTQAQQATTQAPVNNNNGGSSGKNCHGSATMGSSYDSWCASNCAASPPNCPSNYCTCD